MNAFRNSQKFNVHIGGDSSRRATFHHHLTNGTLASLGITDGISGTNDSQSCAFTYDDLGRVGGQDANGYSVDCGSAWQQLFTYDAFGNIVKSGSSSFAATYASATNQFSLSGVSVQYDGDGNLLTDNLNSYTWDPNWGDMTSVNGMTATYDALGDMVEAPNGSGYAEILYSPIGKTAILNGSTLTDAIIGLPGGGTAVYTSSGLTYYRHADWLGSSRLTSTAAQGFDSSTAYAPFGEQYATAGTADPSFTGADSDTVPSLYDFAFRRLSPSQGRWISPDPAGLAAVDPTNPQTWNRYAYVANNPLSFIDPLGLQEMNPNQPPPGCVDYFNFLLCNGEIIYSNCYEGICQQPGPPPGNSGGGGGGTAPAPAPNNGPTASHCAGVALKKNAVALSFDAAGIGAGFLPGGDLVVASAQATVSVASGINSAVNGDAVGGTLGVLGLPAAFSGAAAKFFGVGAKAIPGVGTAFSALGALNDLYNTYQSYETCMAGQS